MAVSAKYRFKLDVSETLAMGLDLAANPTVTHKITHQENTINATSTVPATKAYSDTASLSAGTATLDLTNLAGPISSTVDFTGLKVQIVKVSCPATNTAAVVVDVGATNGYNLFGDANGQITVHPGGIAMVYQPNLLPDVAAGAKTIDLTSSDVDATYSIVLVAG